MNSKEHCNEKPIYVFPEKELRGLSPNFHIHVPVSDLYLSRIGSHIFLQQNRQTDLGNVFLFSGHEPIYFIENKEKTLRASYDRGTQIFDYMD